MPDRGRHVRPRSRRPDHQPAEPRAAEHRHQPAAQRLAGQSRLREHRRVPLLLRADHRGSSSASPRTNAGNLFNQEYAERRYYLNDAFNLAAELFSRIPGVPCMNGISLEPRFTAPSPVNAGETVGFDGMESNITLERRGQLPRGGAGRELRDLPVELRRRHRRSERLRARRADLRNALAQPLRRQRVPLLPYGGTYHVTLTVTDVGGHGRRQPRSSPGRRRPRPPPATARAGQAPRCRSRSNGIVPPPIAAAAIISHSLKKALHKGLLGPLLGQRAGRGALRSAAEPRRWPNACTVARPDRPPACPPARLPSS